MDARGPCASSNGPLSRTKAFLPVLLILSVAGCSKQSSTTQNHPNPAQGARSLFPGAIQKILDGGIPTRNRVKRAEIGDYPIGGDRDYRLVDGMWLPESKDAKDEMFFPEQVRITCTRSQMTCQETKVPLGLTDGNVHIMKIEESDWPIISWDEHGLLASYGPDRSNLAAASDRCHSHVLTMSFASGAVSTSDIPTHEKDCNMFKKTNAYRLVRGHYVIDTSPENDSDKPTK